MTRRDELIWSQQVDESDYTEARVIETAQGAELTLNDELLLIGYRFGKGEDVVADARVLRNKLESQLRASEPAAVSPDTLSAIWWLEYFMDIELRLDD